MKKAICMMTIFCLFVCLLSGCVGKTVVDITPVTVTTDEILQAAPLVFLGKVQSQQSGYYSNPDGSETTATGTAQRLWITPYTVEIIAVYKGDLKQDLHELTVSTTNTYSPADMKLKNIEEETHYLKKGETLVFCVTYREDCKAYVPILGKNGCYTATDKQNIFSNGYDTVDISRMKEHLASAEKAQSTLAFPNSLYIREEDKQK